MFDDLGSAGSLVQISSYKAESPVPVFLRNGMHSVVDNLHAILLLAEPEWWYRFRARATTVVMTSSCHDFLTTPTR